MNYIMYIYYEKRLSIKLYFKEHDIEIQKEMDQ